jgi:NIMA (never in mitosis gene a)-related kinase
MSLSDFEILNKLGEGSYSSVYKVKKISTNTFYALKRVKMNMLSNREKENALNEIRILASIKGKLKFYAKHHFIIFNNCKLNNKFYN